MIGEDDDYEGIDLDCYPNFDPNIRLGRDDLLFVNREFINKVTKTTTFREDEINDLKNLYCSFAIAGKGLNLRKFNHFWTKLTGIEFHPFLYDIFMFFDRNSQDQTLSFEEVIHGLAIVERGDFEVKA